MCILHGKNWIGLTCVLLQENTLEPDPDNPVAPEESAVGSAGEGAGDGAGSSAGDAVGDGAGYGAGDGAARAPAQRAGLISRLSREERRMLEAAFYREGELHITNELVAIGRANVMGFSELWDKMLLANGGSQRKAIQRARSYFRKKKGPSDGPSSIAAPK